MRDIKYIVTNENEGQTLSYIFSEVMNLSGYLIRRNKHIENAVTVNGQHADVRTVVHEGDIVSVQLSDAERRSNVKPAPGYLNIVYEDEDVIVLNKSAEDIVHPDHAHIDNTLGNYLMDYYIRNNDPADFHPVQRLDNGTSGLIIFAKHSYAQNVLSKSIHTESFNRRYLALCHGIIENDYGTIDEPIFRPDAKSIKRVVNKNGQAALTEYEVIKRYRDMTLVKLKLKTGRTHQIRVHMSYLGYPLVGDTLYGGKKTKLISRPALHSYEMEFVHPMTGKTMILRAPIAEDMAVQLKEQRTEANADVM